MTNGNAPGGVRADLLQLQQDRLTWSSTVEIDGVVLSRAAFSKNPFRTLPTFNGMDPEAIMVWLNKNCPLGGSNSWRMKSFTDLRLVVCCDRGRKHRAPSARPIADDGETADGDRYVQRG